MRFIMVSIFIFISTTFLYASEPIVIQPNINEYKIGKNLEILEDKTSELNVYDVVKPDRSEKWFSSKWDVPNFGFTKSTFWFRFEIFNQSPEKNLLLELAWPLFDNIDLYSIHNKEIICLKQTGDLLPFNTRDISNAKFIFKIEPKDNTIYYLRIKAEDTIQVPIKIWKTSEFDKTEQNEKLLFGIYFGILIAILFYNIFIFIFTKDNNYFYYIIYQVMHLFFQISYLGFGYQYLWSQSPWWQNHSMPFFLASGTFFYLLFTKKFLKTKNKFIVINKIFIILMCATLLSAIFTFTIPINYTLLFENISGIFCCSLPFLYSLILLRKGVKEARFFLLGWSFFLIGATFLAGKNMGIFPSNFMTSYSMQIGSVFEVILLSIALADRINIMKQEKEIAQDEIITIQKTYSESLEKTVWERTSELEIERNKLKSKNEIMESDIALAKQIQYQLIPEPDPTNYIYSLYKPMHEVGGDLYDFVHFRDSNKIGIFISDVSGHGVPAAFITSMIKTTILQSGNRKEDPAELMIYINEVLHNQTAGNFITAFYGIYEPDNNSILYANAGHPQPYIINDDGVTQLPKGRNTALAMFTNDVLAESNKTYQNFRATLPANSKLLLYTDGLTEACPIDSRIFFEDDIMMEVFKTNRTFSSQLFIANLYQRLISFRGEDSFEDDVCLVCLNII